MGHDIENGTDEECLQYVDTATYSHHSLEKFSSQRFTEVTFQFVH